MSDYYSIESGNNKFISRVQSLVETTDEPLVFLALDISNFKYINDFYGTNEGDKVMSDMERFFFRDEPLCLVGYGMGFDQFRGIYSMGNMSRDEVIGYIDQKCKEYEAKLSADYPLVYNHVYVGIYFYEDRTVEVRKAIDRSNMAKKLIKGTFNVNCQVFTDINYTEHYNNMYMSNLFMRSVKNDRIVLYIQPKVSISQNCIVGGEALVRMIDDKGNMVMPGEFVPVLERIGLIDRLDRIMIEKVFMFQRSCIDEGKNTYTLSVNVSKQEFTNSKFVDNIFELQEKYRINPELIEFELVESTFVNNLSSIVKTIDLLRSRGFKISVDDFGSGYSSLNQIANIPADIIKLDGVFARESLRTHKGRAVIKSLITMLNEVDYKVVFEGIENAEQIKLVSSYGCDTVQGFYYSKPMEARLFIEKYGSESSLA